MRNKLVVQFQHQGYKSSTHISPNLIWMSRSKVYFLGTSIESMTYLHQIIYTLKIFEGCTGRLQPLLCVVTPWEKFRETIYQISQRHPKLELIFQRLAVPPILLLISWFSGKWPKSVEERIALETLHLQLFLPTESWLVKRNTIKKNSINLRTSLHLGVSASTIQWIAIKGTVWQGALTPKVENLFRWTSVTSTLFVAWLVKGFK